MKKRYTILSNYQMNGNQLSTKVELMAKDIDYLKTEVGEIKQLIKDHTSSESLVWEKVMKQMTEQMKNKADVWVEKALRWGLYTVAGILLTALMGLLVLKTGKISL